MRLQRKHLHQNIFVIFALCVFSCSPRNSLNKAFQKKYGKEVREMNLSRIPPKIDTSTKLNFPKTTVKNTKYSTKESASQYEQYYANVDADEYAKTKPRRFFPNATVFEEGKKSSKNLPDSMFKIRYYTKLSPPFRKSGVEFDLINIPTRDSYGVVTAMSAKEYLLVGNQSLQKNIDQINLQRSVEDVENSKVLIKEQKQLRRRKSLIKVFGRDEVKIDNEKKDDDEIDVAEGADQNIDADDGAIAKESFGGITSQQKDVIIANPGGGFNKK